MEIGGVGRGLVGLAFGSLCHQENLHSSGNYITFSLPLPSLNLLQKEKWGKEVWEERI